MKGNLVRYKIDLKNLPPLTKEQKAELKKLAAMKDEDIDYSDIPPLDDKFFANARHHDFFRPTKSSTTVRVDNDVLAWLKSKGKGYQTRINAILRAAMLKELKK
jgi:uncharacterized protein (DUF4415 family)